MDQNQTVDNDLQKAIDDITNKTNTDPVFSDPVAAPSTIPEGDTGQLGEPIGPFPEPPKIDPLPPAPEPTAPLDTVGVPNITPPMPPVPAADPELPNATVEENLSTRQIKEAALRDLLPLIDKLQMDNEQRFHLYRDVFENLRDYTVLEPAYKAAKELTDETERAEALLYIVEAIDRM